MKHRERGNFQKRSARSMLAVTGICFLWSTSIGFWAHASTIRTSKECYKQGESIKVEFDVAHSLPREGDIWIGVYRDAEEVTLLGDSYVDWIWSCGSKTWCGDNPSSGVVALFLQDESPGTYFAILTPDSVPVYQPRALSSRFRVGNCLSSASIQTTKTKYEPGQVIRTQFDYKNELARKDDWVGIFSETLTEPPTSMTHCALWLWVCGTQMGCSQPIGMMPAILEFDADSEWIEKWPLPPGRWRAWLLRNDFTVISSSATFFVQDTQPSKSPTRLPTLKPTPAPAPKPSTVTTDKSTYFFDELITVSFEDRGGYDGSHAEDNWIGIFPASRETNNLLEKDGKLWQWTCGGQHPNACFSETTTSAHRKSESIVFGTVGVNDGWGSSASRQWPLAAGLYRAHLLEDGDGVDGATYDVLASSSQFEVLPPPTLSESRQALDEARVQIENLVRSNNDLGPKFLRLAFHDCVGGCDGCVDLTFEENGGVGTPIHELVPIVRAHAGPRTGLSRADIWALAALVGCNEARPMDSDIDFLRTVRFGRVDCEHVHQTCQDYLGRDHSCSSTRGPHRDIPGIDTRTTELFAFFNNEFGFTIQETVALMGAHSIGQLSSENSGIDGPNGWVVNKDVLDNDYYVELVGGWQRHDDLETVLEEAPPWVREVEENVDNPFPRKHVWVAMPVLANEQKKIVMLNADIAIVRDLTINNMDPHGRVNCDFQERLGPSRRCPHSAQSLHFAKAYKHNQTKWLEDFDKVLTKMIMAGYGESECMGDVCKLEPYVL